MGQYRPQRRWQAVLIWANSKLDSGVPEHYKELHESGLLRVIHLDDLPDTDTVGLGLMRLVTADINRPEDIRPQVIQLQGFVTEFANDPRRAAIIELIDKALLCKFPQLTSEDLKAMFGLADLKETKVYQEALLEGEARGEARGKIIGRLQTVSILAELGLSAEDIAKRLDLEIELVQEALNGDSADEEDE